jgi:DoxX-like family
MFVAYIIVTIIAAAANIFSATLDFIRFKQILVNMAKVGVPESWITMLGTLKAAGAVGLLVGMGVPPIGVAAAIGLVLFFIGAVITHLCAGDYSFGLAVIFLLLAAAALVLRLASA